MSKFIITDWANNVCFKGKRFDSFEDAWGFIYKKHPEPESDNDGTFDDYYVIELKEYKGNSIYA